jgi:ferritin-like metal-binding protein YciE
VNQIKFEIADLRHNDQTQALFKQQLEDTKQKVHRLEFVIESIETPAPKKID